MRNTILFFSFILLLAVYSCKKEGCTDPAAINYDDEAKKDDGSCEYDTIIQFEFDSLISENDSITPGESTNITAHAKGTSLNYAWESVSGEGNIIGNDSIVSFKTIPCMLGDYEIKCTVSDFDGSSDTKSVFIHVEF